MCYFISVVSIVFVMIYAFNVHWSIAPAFLITVTDARSDQFGVE